MWVRSPPSWLDGYLAEQIGFEDQCVCRAVQSCQQVVPGELDGLDDRTLAFARGGDELEPLSAAARRDSPRGAALADARAADVVRGDARAHQDVRERGRLGCRIPPVDVE